MSDMLLHLNIILNTALLMTLYSIGLYIEDLLGETAFSAYEITGTKTDLNTWTLTSNCLPTCDFENVYRLLTVSAVGEQHAVDRQRNSEVDRPPLVGFQKRVDTASFIPHWFTTAIDCQGRRKVCVPVAALEGGQICRHVPHFGRIGYSHTNVSG